MIGYVPAPLMAAASFEITYYFIDFIDMFHN